MMEQNDNQSKTKEDISLSDIIDRTLEPVKNLLEKHGRSLPEISNLKEEDVSWINQQFIKIRENLGDKVLKKNLQLEDSVFKNIKRVRDKIAHLKDDFSCEELFDLWKDIFPALPEIKAELEKILPKENKDPQKRRFRKYGPKVLGSETDREQLMDAISERCELLESGEISVPQIEFPEDVFSQNIKQILSEILSQNGNQKYIAQHSGLSKNIQSDLLEWIKNVDERLLKENPFEKEEAFIESLKKKSAEEIENSLSQIQNDYEKISSGKIDFDFYKKEFEKIEEDCRGKLDNDKDSKIKQKAVAEHLTDAMEQSLIDRKNSWQHKLIDEMRKKLIAELLEKLEKFKKLEILISDIFDGTGFLWGLAEGLFQESGFEILKQYADLLEKDESLQELAKILGKHSRAQKEYEKELRAKTVIKTEYHPKPAYKGQISGIRMSSDISSALPSELVLFKNSATKKLFELKFAQNQLMSWKYENLVPEEKSETQMEEMSKEKDEQKGPVIICVDTSGSMCGTPENIAKTITFALSKIALEEKRDCYLISFSIGIETLDLSFSGKSNSEVLQTLVSFLRKSFGGGTDASLALKHALKMLQSENWKSADVLMISDFVMGNLDSTLTEKIEAEKKNKTNFYSLVIGSGGNPDTIKCFNHNWLYDMNSPNASRHLVEQLEEIKK